MSKQKLSHWLDRINSDAFVRDLAKLAAKHLKKVKPEDRDIAKMYLQDSTSLYSPYCAELIEEHLK